MAAQGHRPSAYDGQAAQAPGLMHHGSILGPGPAVLHLVEPLPHPELLEKKIVIQEAEMERLLRENQRLAASHTTLRQEFLGTQQEMQRLKSHVGSFRTESDIQLRGMLDRIGKMEADYHTGDIVTKELQQAHSEAQRLAVARQELKAEMQIVTEELQSSSNDLKRLPEMHANLDSLRQEHHNLRIVFEHEKKLNIELVDQMQSMEKNLMSMSKEVEKLRADVSNAEQRANVPIQYGGPSTSQNPTYVAAGQVSQQPDHSYGQGSGYAVDGAYSYNMVYQNPGFNQGLPAAYNEAYGMPQVSTAGGIPTQAQNLYASGMNGAVYVDAYGRPLVQAHAGLVPAEGINPYAHISVGTYDTAKLASESSGK